MCDTRVKIKFLSVRESFISERIMFLVNFPKWLKERNETDFPIVITEIAEISED